MRFEALDGDIVEEGHTLDEFGQSLQGNQREADRQKVPLLGQIPIDIATRESGDRGNPITSAEPESAIGKAFIEIAQKLRQTLGH